MTFIDTPEHPEHPEEHTVPMPNTRNEFQSPDLGFIPAASRLSDRTDSKIILFGVGSLGRSIQYALDQMGFQTVMAFDNDIVERRNLINTIGFTPRDVGASKAPGRRTDILQQSLTGIFRDNFTSRQTRQPSFIFLTTDNLLTRSVVMRAYRTYLQRTDRQNYTKLPILIDIRSSATLIRAITLNPNAPNFSTLALTENAAVNNQIQQRLAYLYPAVTPGNQGWTWEGDTNHDQVNTEGSCSARGSMMHTFTAVAQALQSFMRALQSPTHLPAYLERDTMPWTGMQTEQALPEDHEIPLLKDYTATYSRYNPSNHTGRLLVSSQVLPEWTTLIPEVSNKMLYVATPQPEIHQTDALLHTGTVPAPTATQIQEETA